MKIQVKIVLVVLPIMIVTLIIVGSVSFFAAFSSVTRIAQEFLNFKALQIEKYADSQWQLLVQYGLTEQNEMVVATKVGVQSFARTVVRSDTENVIAFNAELETELSTSDIELLPEDIERLRIIYDQRSATFNTIQLGDSERVYVGFFFAPFEWLVLVTEERAIFYRDVDRITFITLYVLVGGIVISILLLLVLSRFLTRPLNRVVNGMQHIITSNDMSERVAVEYKDETGHLAHTFNLMISELERAYNQIKGFALNAVMSRKKEMRIRNIFQKYVPNELINSLFKNPESLLVGDNRSLSILFSDIRGFSTISESMLPDDLVNCLNRYFSVMVDIITDNNGVVDKYIGDAIMAIFGAPISREDDTYKSVLTGIEMTEAIGGFNAKQREIGKPEFHIGIGINYGIVTVGNIGTDKKMDYTVIGDTVNLASRLEGLTKIYKQMLIISDSLYDKISQHFPGRFLDLVAVKGKSKGTRLYTIKRTLDPKEKKAWDVHNEAMEMYFQRDFERAEIGFREVQGLFPGDHNAGMFIERCKKYRHTPPPEDWNGIEKIATK